MAGHKHAGMVWNLTEKGGGPRQNQYSHETIQSALLMDIRDELQKLNAVLACPNFVAIPKLLREIRRNTTKKKRKP